MKQEDIFINSILEDRWKFRKRLGSGAHGDVYEAFDINSGNPVVIKLTRDEASKAILHWEIEMYETVLRRCPAHLVNFLCRPYFEATVFNYKFLIMEMLGVTLFSLYFESSFRIPEEITRKIFKKSLLCIEKLHRVGIVHRDIKPQNICLGSQNNIDELKLIDLGLATSYIDNFTGYHTSKSFQKHRFIGTRPFASHNQHLGGSPNRADDLESLCYTMMFLFKFELPWFPRNSPLGCVCRRGFVVQKWKSISAETICKDYPPVFESFLRHVREIPFGETPDYSYLYRVLDRSFDNSPRSKSNYSRSSSQSLHKFIQPTKIVETMKKRNPGML